MTDLFDIHLLPSQQVIMAVRYGRRYGWVIGAYISVTCRSSTATLYVDV
jgi:hypothetical protein